MAVGPALTTVVSDKSHQHYRQSSVYADTHSVQSATQAMTPVNVKHVR